MKKKENFFFSLFCLIFQRARSRERERNGHKGNFKSRIEGSPRSTTFGGEEQKMYIEGCIYRGGKLYSNRNKKEKKKLGS